MSNTITSIDQLKRAIIVAEQIEKLQAELNQILGGNHSTAPAATPTAVQDPRKGKRSPAVRARMAAAQRARWAKKQAAETGSKVAAVPAASAATATLTTPKTKKAAAGKSIPLSELKVLLEKAPDKTLNVRRAGLQLANLKTLANANPHLLKLGGKGAWPTITMLK